MIKIAQAKDVPFNFKRKKLLVERLSCLSLTTALLAPALSADIQTREVSDRYNSEASQFNQGSRSELDCTLSDADSERDIKETCSEVAEPARNFLHSFLPQLVSGTGISPWLIGGAGVGLATAAAAASGGGGGDGGDESSPAGSSYEGIESTNPSAYATQEYNNRADLEAINANEAYANITRRILSSSDNARASLTTGATHGGEGITIAILDTGVDATHTSIRDNMSSTCTTTACQEYIAISDPDGHGTHVAGIAAGDRTGQNNSMHGVAYNATILAGCAFVAGGCYERTVSDGELLGWAANNGAMVANMSYGYTQGSRGKVVTDITGGAKDYTHARLKDYLFGSYSSSENSDYQKAKAALKQGLITAIAAGNTLASAPENLQPSVMAVAPLIYANTDLHNDLSYQWITVVNIDNYDNLSSSSHACGDAAAFCLAAPGSRIYSTLPGGGYGRMSGTSMAAPQVSGGVALLAGAFPSLTLPSNHEYASVCDAGSSRFNSKQCHSKAVVNRLFVTATDLGTAGIDATYGNGMINLDSATRLVGTAQLQSASGAVYDLSGSTLIASGALATAIPRQLVSIYFLATDSYDNAGFIYNGQTLLGSEDEADSNPRIHTLQYLNRSMSRQSLSSIVLSPSLTFSFSHAHAGDDLNKGHYQFNYTLNDFSSVVVGYGFNEQKDFSIGDYQHLAVNSLSASQAFNTPLSYFSEDARGMGFKQIIGDGYSVTANLRQAQVSEVFTDNAESLNTTSMTLALNGELTSRLRGSLVAGTLSEESSVLGTHGTGFWAVEGGSQSLMAGINLSYEVTPVVTALFSYYRLSTEVGQSNDLLSYSDNLVSDSFSIGLVAQEDCNWQYGVFAAQPVRTNDGRATLSLPTGYNGQSLSYSNIDLALTPEGRHMEYEFAVSWKSDSLPVIGKFNLIRIEDYGNVVGNSDNIALFSLGFPF